MLYNMNDNKIIIYNNQIPDEENLIFDIPDASGTARESARQQAKVFTR